MSGSPPPQIRSIRINGRTSESFHPGSLGYLILELLENAEAERSRLLERVAELESATLESS